MIDFGYGYDVFQNSDTLKSDLKNLASSVRSDLSDRQAIQAVKDLIDSHKVLVDKTWQFKAGGGIDTPKALMIELRLISLTLFLTCQS